MKVKDIAALARELAVKADPRGKPGVERWLKLQRKAFGKLPPKERKYFDQERLVNPYMDSRVNFDSGKTVKKVLVGIDIAPAEVLLARHLQADLVISHHPAGNALANLDEVMHLQADLLHATAGVPINVAEAVLKKRAREVARKIQPANHHQVVDAARILGVSFLSLHTVCDNLVWKFISGLLERKKPETVGEVLEVLRRVPEYQEGLRRGEGPRIFAGEPSNRVGQLIASEFTGGTEPGKELYEHLSRAGVGTVVGMHIAEDAREEAEKYHINVVVAGHMSSDSLGMNLLLDRLESSPSGNGIKIIPCSGLIRVKR